LPHSKQVLVGQRGRLCRPLAADLHVGKWKAEHIPSVFIERSFVSSRSRLRERQARDGASAAGDERDRIEIDIGARGAAGALEDRRAVRVLGAEMSGGARGGDVGRSLYVADGGSVIVPDCRMGPRRRIGPLARLGHGWGHSELPPNNEKADGRASETQML